MVSRRNSKGYTLIELVMVIVLLGIIAGVVAPFILKAMQAYTASKARAELVAKGRLAMERLAREVRVAVPNSLTVLDTGNGIEFARGRAGGRYVERFDDYGTEFRRVNYRFRRNANLSNLYSVGTSLGFIAGDVLVIGNTSPVELQAGNTRVALTNIVATDPAPTGDATANGQVLQFGGKQFAIESPGRHFTLADQTIEIGRVGTTLRWHNQPGIGADYDGAVDYSAADPSLVDGVTAVVFTYSPGNPQSSAVLRMDLSLVDTVGTETLRLYQEVHVRNTP